MRQHAAADRTEEHREFFDEGREAEFLDTQEELMEKAKFYSIRESARRKIAQAGRERCSRSGYAYVRRFKAALEFVQRL
ncbi:MAG: glycosyltransferase [Candidatus Sulfotelmatobacter sp.]